MTGYYLSVGYNSGSGGDADDFGTLVTVFEAVIRDPDRIVAEVRRVEPPAAETRTLREYAAWYTHPDRREGEDCSFRIYRQPSDLGPLTNADDFSPFIAQYASGGGSSRAIKEVVRRAVCRLVIADMHRRGVEVNFKVK